MAHPVNLLPPSENKQHVKLLTDRQALLKSLKKSPLPETREELVQIVKTAAAASGHEFEDKDINWVVTQIWTSATTRNLFPQKK